MLVIERSEEYVVEYPETTHKTLEPFFIFEQDTQSKRPKVDHALILLNTALTNIPIEKLWTHSSNQVCADGGANRLYDYFKDPKEREKHIPKYITGDCDSLKDYVREYYLSKGSRIIPQLSQYSTDFMKAIKVVILHHNKSSREALEGQIEENDGLSQLIETHGQSKDMQDDSRKIVINVAGGIGGRFDQTFHSINQLYVMSQEFPRIDFFFFTPEDVIFLLPKGTTLVTYSSRTIFNTKDKIPKCGLLPFGEKVTLSTNGLQYDVENWPSEVGGSVSSSNGISGVDKFIVQSDGRLVMNIEIKR